MSKLHWQQEFSRPCAPFSPARVDNLRSMCPCGLGDSRRGRVVRWRGPQAHATVVDGSAMRYTAEAIPLRRPGHHRLAHEWPTPGASLRSRPWNGPCSNGYPVAAGLPPRTAGLSGDVPAPRRRGNALEQPLRLASPIHPLGAQRSAPAPLRSARATGSCHPATPSRGLCGSLTAPGGQRLCRSCHWPSVAFPRSLPSVAMYCRRAPASRPALATRATRTTTAVWLLARARGRRARC
jgi:hypothetical protein